MTATKLTATVITVLGLSLAATPANASEPIFSQGTSAPAYGVDMGGLSLEWSAGRSVFGLNLILDWQHLSDLARGMNSFWTGQGGKSSVQGISVVPAWKNSGGPVVSVTLSTLTIGSALEKLNPMGDPFDAGTSSGVGPLLMVRF